MALQSTLPAMAEPINFAFLHGQDHLSDYTLVLEARDPAAPAADPAPIELPVHRDLLAIPGLPSSAPPAGQPAAKPSADAAAAAAVAAGAAGPSARALRSRGKASTSQQQPDAGADAATRNAGGASCSDTTAAPPNRRITRAFKRQKSEAAADSNTQPPQDTAAPADQPKSRAARRRKRTPAPALTALDLEAPGVTQLASSLQALPSPTEAVRARDTVAAARQVACQCMGLPMQPDQQLQQQHWEQKQQRRQQQRQPSSRRALLLQQERVLDTSTASSESDEDMPRWKHGAAAAAGAAQPNRTQPSGSQQGAVVRRITIPAHGVVLSVMSDYFKAIIEKWNGDDKRIVVQVTPDELDTAAALVAFMYTGRLPSLDQEDMLTLMKLADRYQVKNCPAACARKFADTPLSELQLETVAAIFEWPSFLQEGASEPFGGVLAKAAAKLMDVFGDMEAAWRDDARKESFLKLPFKAVKLLAESDELRCYSENTLLCAVASWIEVNIPAWRYWQQHTELAELVRLQHLSPCFLGSVVKKLNCMSCAVGGESLILTSRYIAANAATRAKLHALPNKQGRQKVLHSAQRAHSDTGRLEFEWQLELKEVRDLISQFKANRATVDRYSPPYFFNGFDWQFVLQVLEPPARPPGHAATTTPAPPVDVFVGATAKVRVGSSSFLPDVVYFRGALAARELSTGDFTFVNRMESGFVCGTAGWGFRNFLRITDWDNEELCRRFFYDGKLHLRCSIDHCE